MGMAIILVSHDLALVDDVCDRVVVMHAGTCVESGSVERAGDAAAPLYPRPQPLAHRMARPGSELVTIKGQPPGGRRLAAGLPVRRALRDRPSATVASATHPPLFGPEDSHRTACLHSDLIGE